MYWRVSLDYYVAIMNEFYVNCNVLYTVFLLLCPNITILRDILVRFLVNFILYNINDYERQYILLDF